MKPTHVMRLVVMTGVLLGLAVSTASTQQKTPATSTGFIKEFGTMWTFDAPPLDYWKQTYGFAPDQAWLDHVRLASVRLPGCSSSFVSENGLVLTNHHCARSCISATSPADSNYQETGFVAKTLEEEKPCPRVWVDQLQSIDDVTARIRQSVTATEAAQQVEQRQAAIDATQEECVAATGLICQVVTFYQGGMYSLYRYKRFDDVRLVMAPEGQAAFFGGDPDNFTYPRYDLDITLLRVYENGAPRKTDHYFTWSKNGAAEGELVFVTGNPGSTGRLLTMAQMEYLRDVQYPAQLAGIERQLAMVRTLAAASPEARRQYENQIFGLENSHKAISGYLTGLRDPEKMARKKAFEADFRSRIDRDRALKQKYGSAWDAIAAAQAQLTSIAIPMRWWGFGGSQLMSLAGGLVRLPQQTALPEEQRLTQYRGNRLDQLRAQVLRDQEFDLEQEITSLAVYFEAAKAELQPTDPYLTTMLAGREPRAAAEALIRGTKLTDVQVRTALVAGGDDAVAASKDPLIVAARKIAPLSLELASQADALNATISANAELVGQAIFAAYGKALPPDATFTLRISDGVAKRYPMNGTFAPYKTTLYGLYARAEEFGHEDPWVLAPRWKERRDRLDLATPINWVSTNDIIGGNSGSPVINKNGEVVGLVFDGNIQMLPNRFIFTDEVSRTVSVHSAGIIEGLRKVYDAERIADELQGIKK
ncbi:MAG: S46 family peptidase [Gemmatimonadota bacterium]|nr:S46 family peptidase [Gemmatimonadota bacterium]MDH3479701.1 S46 family peptidase [Gemmatimonadota bacterium]MDH3570281.1 S46 family peptidase [Gemmatimonadota bacterium]